MATLPFLTANTPRIEKFLTDLRDQADQMHSRLNEGGTLTADDWNKLAALRKQSVFFEGELGNLMGIVGNGMIRWRDTVKVTGPAKPGNTPTPITKSITQLDQALAAPPGQENAMAPQNGPLKLPRLDPGPRVDEATAVAAAQKFVDMPLAAPPRITGRSDPADREHTFSLYFLDAQKQNGTPLHFGVSIHGGHVIYMLDGRAVTAKNLTVAQLIQRARDMLRRRGYTTVEYVSSVENDGTLVIDFAPIEKGVAVEVDKVKIMLAMDNGELVGFDARNYWINRHTRQLPAAALSASDAVKRVAPKLKTEGQPRLALIADRRDKERLTWEIHGGYDNQRYRIFIDALTGQEVDIQRVTGDPAPPITGT
jgi:spore germination protein